jgi:hypothetical protein
VAKASSLPPRAERTRSASARRRSVTLRSFVNSNSIHCTRQFGCRCPAECESRSTRHVILGDHATVTARGGSRLTRSQFAFLARVSATSRAADSPCLFVRRFLGLHGCLYCGDPKKKNGQFCTVTSKVGVISRSHCCVHAETLVASLVVPS